MATYRITWALGIVLLYATTVTCNECQPGSAATQLDSSSCEQCRKGTYSDTGGSTICKNCTKDQTTYGVGYTYCIDCGSGYSTPGPGSATCQGCPRVSEGLQKEWSWVTHSCHVVCAYNWAVYEMIRINGYGIQEWGCVYKPLEYGRIWGIPTLPEHEPTPWRSEDLPGIIERNPVAPHLWFHDWMTVAPTTTPAPSTAPQPTTPLPTTTTPIPTTTTTTPTPIATGMENLTDLILSTMGAVTTTDSTSAPIVSETSTNGTLTIGLIIGGVVVVLALISIYYWGGKYGTSTGHHAMIPVQKGILEDVKINQPVVYKFQF
jgi:hypothetical protein